MEGFILAAGLGTRLRPLTDDRPKALVEISEKRTMVSGEWREEKVTLLELAIRRLEEAGVEHIVVNVHHFAEKVIDFIGSRRWQATVDISDERSLLLDTGGGLRHAAPLFSGRDNVLVHNVDILSDLDLRAVERHHREAGNLATLCVSDRDTRRKLRFDAQGMLLGRENDIRNSEFKNHNSHLLAFSGISVVSPALFALLPVADHPYPIIDQYVSLSAQGHRIGSFCHPADRWLDVGKPETLEIAKQWNRSSSK